MKLTALALGALLTTPASAGDDVLGDSAKGKKHYEAICSACHGPQGDGNGPAGSSLSPKPRDFTDAAVMGELSDEYLIKVISEGGAAVGKSPLMPPWGGVLKPKDVRDVAAFVRSWAPLPEAPVE